jgi:GxxExxY protein
MTDQIDDTLTYSIIGCAMKVHNKLGNGFQEVIYQRALEIEFDKAGLRFSREEDVPVYYYDDLVGTRRVDFLFRNELILELKAVSKLEDRHLAQGLNYLVTYKLEKGLLINFGAKRLEIKRLRHPRNLFNKNMGKN